MAKFVLIVACFLLVLATLCEAGINKEQLMKTIMVGAKECQAEVGATEADVEDMISKKPAAGREGKCLRSCLMKKLKLMDDNGKFVGSVALDYAKECAAGDAEKLKTYTEVIDSCVGIEVSSDACDATEQYKQCLMDQAKAHGIERFEF